MKILKDLKKNKKQIKLQHIIGIQRALYKHILFQIKTIMGSQEDGNIYSIKIGKYLNLVTKNRKEQIKIEEGIYKSMFLDKQDELYKPLAKSLEEIGYEIVR